MFKPGNKVKRIAETHYRDIKGAPADVIKGKVYTVRTCSIDGNITLVGFGGFTYNHLKFRLIKENKMTECTCEKKTAPHKHADVIKAWADGAIIQHKVREGEWKTVYNNKPTWNDYEEYRVKPEPKPDFMKYARVDKFSGYQYWCKSAQNIEANVIYTFDGETGKLKSAEVIS